MTRVNRRRYMSHFLPDIDGHDGGYLTLTALEDTTFTLTIGSGVGSDCSEIYYSIDDGETWVYTQNENFLGVTITTPLITKGNWVLWKGVNKRMSKAATITGSSRFSSDGLFSVGGSLQSLIWGDEYETKLSTKDWLSFAWLFRNSKVRNARNLKFTATSMSPATYSGMFSECYYLKTPPKEIKYGALSAYINLFSGCIHLKYGPDILIETLPTECLKGMFNGCKQLKCVKILSADISASNCLLDWMKGVNPTGTFIKMIDMTFPSGQSGIPTGWSTSDCIMSVNTNPAVLSICYAQGWAANDNYMTKSEAEAVTDIDNAFTNNAVITHFLEFEYFGVTSLKQGKGFNGCTSLESISIPPTLRSVGYQSFQNCTSISKVVIKDMAAWLVIDFPYSMDNPINYAHKIYSDENTIVTSLTIPSTITKLGKGCLTGWKDLTSVVIPNNITSIGSNVFANCTNLSSVTLPNTITTLASQVFASCGFSGVFAIPEGITTVDNQWIWGNGNITRLEFPSTITTIGNFGFHYNVGNKNVVIKATTPPSYNNSTGYIGTNTKIYVPDASVNTYKTSSYWSNLANYIYPMSELPT